MNDWDSALECYHNALKCNQWSVPAMQGIASILRYKDQFQHAAEYLRAIIKIEPTNGEVLSGLGRSSSRLIQLLSLADCCAGHCYLMMDDLQQAYSAYQEALYHLTNPRVCLISLSSFHV